MEALNVTRNAKVGAAVGVVLAVAVYGFFVVLPGLSTTASLRFLVLAFVVAVSTTLLVTVVLTVRRVARMAMSPPKWIRRGGTLGAAGGAVLTALAVTSPAVESVAASNLVLTASTLALVGGIWAVNAAHRRRYGRGGVAGATLAAVGLAALGWIGVVEPTAVAAGRLYFVEPAVFLGVCGLALGGTTVLGAALVAAGSVSRLLAVGLLLALPAGLAGATAAVAAGVPDLAFAPLGLALGVPWMAIGFALRRGRGIPPEETFERGIELDADG